MYNNKPTKQNINKKVNVNKKTFRFGQMNAVKKKKNEKYIFIKKKKKIFFPEKYINTFYDHYVNIGL